MELKSAIEVMDLLTDQLAHELQLAIEDEEHEVDIKLANNFIKMYYSLIEAGNEVIEEYDNALVALDHYAYELARVNHSAYATLLVKITVLSGKLSEQKRDKGEQVSSMTNKELKVQMMLFNSSEE